MRFAPLLPAGWLAGGNLPPFWHVLHCYQGSFLLLVREAAAMVRFQKVATHQSVSPNRPTLHCTYTVLSSQPLLPCSGILFHGVPGTGKTLVARALAGGPQAGSPHALLTTQLPYFVAALLASQPRPEQPRAAHPASHPAAAHHSGRHSPPPPSRPAGACAKHSPTPVTFFARKGADCLGKFHGEAERTLRLLFEEVRGGGAA